MKNASKTQKMTFDLVRRIGIRADILPKNFPSSDRVQVLQIDDKKSNWGGMGGIAPDDVTKRMRPFICINMYYARSVAYLMAAYAHEMLHVKQIYCDKKPIGHGNDFRAESAKFAKALGVDYYLVFGYDGPSKATAKAMAKKHEKWLLHFSGRQDIKDKMYQDSDI